MYAAKTENPALWSFLSLIPQIAVTLWPMPQTRWKTSLIAISQACIGITIDCGLIWLGYFTFPTAPESLWPLVPIWIVPIWLGFGFSQFDMAPSFKGRYWLAAILGAITGPISYKAGVEMDVLQINGSLIWLGALWCLLFPGFVWMNLALEEWRTP